MENIFTIKFTFEQNAREKVIINFSNKQGGDFNVFSYHWQCFAWAAIIGFLHDRRRPLQAPKADQVFSLNTMMNNGGERIAEALICMCIAKSKSLDIMKTPQVAIDLINEYANGGFDYIIEKVRTEGMTNDFEWVKQEIFGREIVGNNVDVDMSEEIPALNTDAMEFAMKDIEQEVKIKEIEKPKTRNRWTTSQIGELQLYLRQGMNIDMLLPFLTNPRKMWKQKLQNYISMIKNHMILMNYHYC